MKSRDEFTRRLIRLIAGQRYASRCQPQGLAEDGGPLRLWYGHLMLFSASPHFCGWR